MIFKTLLCFIHDKKIKRAKFLCDDDKISYFVVQRI